jgi:histidinol-phosphate aminotransferase
MSRTARRPLRPEMEEVPAYVTSTADAPIRLDRNESPEEMPAAMREEVLARLASARWSRYPDPYAAELKAALAAREGLSPDRVIVGNGSNSLLLAFFLAAAGPGRRIGICPPTFGLYAAWARAAGAGVRTFPLAEEDLAPPVEAMIREACRDPDLAFVLCSPNNPSGTLFPREGLLRLLDTGALVVLDEAYTEFSGDTARDLLARFPNLLLSRTLSKAAALAGVRVGYFLGGAPLLADIEKVVPPFSVNLFARAAALATLSGEAALRDRVAAIVAERQRMARSLAENPGGRMSESHANFLYLRPERSAERLFDALLSRGILVRRVAGTSAGALRVTVGRPEENDRFLEAWREVIR